MLGAIDSATDEIWQVTDPTQGASPATEAALRQNPITAAPTRASDAFDALTEGPGSVADAEVERISSGTFTGTDDVRESARGAAGGAREAVTPEIPWWTKYAVAGIGVLVVLAVLAPYAKLGAEVTE